MFKNTSLIMKQTFRNLIVPQYKRNFCCALSSHFTIPESKQCHNNKLKINHQNNFRTLWPNYSFSTKSDQSSEKTKPVNTTDDKKSTKEDDLIIDIPHQKKLGLVARFKLMYKQYWYVLIPVHVTTSIGWVGAFYYLSKSGVDIISLLQALHVSEVLVEKFQDSNMGHYAIAYLCYKIITPLRYAVTIGGTTLSIKYLVRKGYIKPVPTKQEFIKMYEEKKAKMKRKDN